MEWYPRYPALWRAKTMHLDPFQDGCYLRLVDHYMETRQPLPDNDIALARIIGISVNEWGEGASEVVRRFFKPRAGKLHHDRCNQILIEQDGRARKGSEKGRKGAQARWNKNNSIDAPSMPEAMPADATGQDRTRQEIKTHSQIGAAAHPIALPDEWNPTVDHESRCQSLGFDCMKLAAAFRNNHRAKGATFVDWDAAFDVWIGNESKFGKSTKGGPGNGKEKANGRDEGKRIAEKHLASGSLGG